MRRTFMLLSLLAVAGPALAANYSVRLAGSANGHIVARDINWACSGGACEGSTNESRPAVLCQALAKRVGRVESFLVDGRTIGVTDLEKCNAAARGDGNKATGAQ